MVQPLLQGGSASAPLTNQALSCRAKPGLLRTARSHPAISCQQKRAAGITPNSKLKKAPKTQLKQSYLCSQTPEAQLMDLLEVPAGTRHTLSIGKLYISFQMQTGLQLLTSFSDLKRSNEALERPVFVQPQKTSSHWPWLKTAHA